MLENWYWFWYWIVSGESIGTGIGPKKVVLLISVQYGITKQCLSDILKPIFTFKIPTSTVLGSRNRFLQSKVRSS